ncbi:LacI family DNA-binding transcriptional regulator [Paenibacillus sp. 1_12]|nr:LacI family DNA-binding transcriptional regulator [Paenibacillus sp. 1_12]
MISRRDVADRAGVSAAVVSYVLSYRNVIKEQTRQTNQTISQSCGKM